MASSGFADESGLKIVHDVWSGFIPTSGEDRSGGTHWSEIEALNRATVERLRAGGFEVEAAAERQIVDCWTFPLHAIDLWRLDTTKSVDEERRRERAAVWDASDYADAAADAWDNGPSDFARDALDAVPSDQLDYGAEMARMKAAYVRAERQRFIESE